MSTLDGEYSPTFDALRGELVFMRRTPGLFDYTLVRSRFDDGRWTATKTLPCSETWRDAAPYRAGIRILSAGPEYATASVDPSAATIVSYLYVDPEGCFAVMEGRRDGRRGAGPFCSCSDDDGGWAEPVALEAVNTVADEGGPWVTGPGGHLLFTSTRPAGQGRSGNANLRSIPVAALGIPCLR